MAYFLRFNTNYNNYQNKLKFKIILLVKYSGDKR